MFEVQNALCSCTVRTEKKGTSFMPGKLFLLKLVIRITWSKTFWFPNFENIELPIHLTPLVRNFASILTTYLLSKNAVQSTGGPAIKYNNLN